MASLPDKARGISTGQSPWHLYGQSPRGISTGQSPWHLYAQKPVASLRTEARGIFTDRARGIFTDRARGISTGQAGDSRQLYVGHAAEDDALAACDATRVYLGVEDGSWVGDHGG